MRTSHKKWLFVLLTTLLFATGCGGGSKGSDTPQENEAGAGAGNGTVDNTGSGDTEDDNTIASVRITPGGVLLTGSGESRAMSAAAYNAAGKPVPVEDIIWTSTKPTKVSIDINGTVRSTVSLGSALITAKAGRVTSEPVLVTVAKPAAGAVLVDDTHIVGAISPVDPNVPLSPGSLYDVTLTGVPAPSAGDILLGTGEAPVAGKVVSTSVQGQNVTVTLEFVDIDQVFESYDINETMPLSLSDALINSDIEAGYDVTQNADGSLTFTPKPGVAKPAKAAPDKKTSGSTASFPEPGEVEVRSNAPGGAVGTSALGPFECNTTLSVFPLGLSTSPTFTLTTGLSSTFIWRSDYKKLAVTGEVKAVSDLSLVLTSSVTGKVTCQKELLMLPLPIGGAASIFFGGYVPVGVGIEVGGTLELQGLGFDLKNTSEATLTAGIEYTNGSWGLLSDYTSRSKADVKWIPPGSGFLNTLRLRPSLSGYGFVNMEIGFRYPSVARWEVLSAKIGLKLSGTLAVVGAQIENTSFASDYQLSVDASIGPGSDITAFLSRFHLNMTAAAATFNTPLSGSPKALRVASDKDQFTESEVVNFNVKLNPSTVENLSVYNVSSVQIYSKTVDSSGNVSGELVREVRPDADGQTDFSIPWLADYDGSITGDGFYAFVVNSFIPFPYFDSLELGEVKPQSNQVAYKITGFYIDTFDVDPSYGADCTYSLTGCDTKRKTGLPITLHDGESVTLYGGGSFGAGVVVKVSLEGNRLLQKITGIPSNSLSSGSPMAVSGVNGEFIVETKDGGNFSEIMGFRVVRTESSLGTPARPAQLGFIFTDTGTSSVSTASSATTTGNGTSYLELIETPVALDINIPGVDPDIVSAGQHAVEVTLIIDGAPAAGKDVQANNQTVTTNGQGKAVFSFDFSAYQSYNMRASYTHDDGITYTLQKLFYVDKDSDGIGRGDNCPSTYNPGQADGDGNGAGDACDLGNGCGSGYSERWVTHTVMVSSTGTDDVTVTKVLTHNADGSTTNTVDVTGTNVWGDSLQQNYQDVSLTGVSPWNKSSNSRVGFGLIAQWGTNTSNGRPLVGSAIYDGIGYGPVVSTEGSSPQSCSSASGATYTTRNSLGPKDYWYGEWLTNAPSPDSAYTSRRDYDLHAPDGPCSPEGVPCPADLNYTTELIYTKTYN